MTKPALTAARVAGESALNQKLKSRGGLVVRGLVIDLEGYPYMNINFKLQLLDGLVCSVLRYGCEIWGWGIYSNTKGFGVMLARICLINHMSTAAGGLGATQAATRGPNDRSAYGRGKRSKRNAIEGNLAVIRSCLQAWLITLMMINLRQMKNKNKS